MFNNFNITTTHLNSSDHTSLPSTMPRKVQPKGKVAKTAKSDTVLTQQHVSGSVNPLPKAHPKPQPISTLAATMTPQATEMSTKSEGNTEFTSTSPVPPLHHGVHTCKVTIFPDASDHPQEKKKASATQARLEKEKKDKIMQKKVKNIAAYEKRVQEMGFEATLIPSPPGATFKGKIPEIKLTRGSMMDIDNEYGVEDFAAKIAAISDHGSDSVDEREFHGFYRSAHTAMNIEEGKVESKESKESEEENSPLYRMEVLTSKAANNFLPSEGEDNHEDDHKDTPIARKVMVKGKGKVVEEGRQVKRGKDLIVERKTEGVLLHEMIVTACDQPNSGNACGLLHGLVNSEGVGLCIYILASPYHHDILTDT